MGLAAIGGGIASAVGGIGSALGAGLGAVGGLSGAAGLASTGLGLANSIGGVIGGSNASSQATNAQVNANNAASALNKPYYDAGVGALNQLNQFLTPGFDATSAIQSTPGYQFQYNQGLDAGNRAAAAAGTLNSGGTLKAQTRYGQGFAQNAYQNQLNNLYKVAGLGDFAVNNMSGNLLNIGDAKAQNAVAQNGVLQNGLGQLANGLSGLGGLGGGSAPAGAPPSQFGGINLNTNGLNMPASFNPGISGSYIPNLSFGGI